MKPVMSRLRQARFALALSGVLCLGTLPAWAQARPERPAAAAAQAPQTLTFDVSPDHATIDAEGPRVIKYIVDFTPVDGGKARSLDLGKPEAPNGTISVPLAQAELSNGRYLATVRVVGQTMTTTSATVGPFQIGKERRAKSAEEQTPPPAVSSPSGPAPAAAPGPASSPTEADRRGFWKRIYSLIVG